MVRSDFVLAAHIGGGLLLAWTSWSASAGLSGLALFALVLADAGLVGMWGALSGRRWGWRLSAVLVASVWLWGLVTRDSRISVEYSLSLFLVIALTAASIMAILSGFRHGRRKLRLTRLTNDLPAIEGFQFSIRQVLLATAIMAAVLGIGRVVRNLDRKSNNVTAVAIFPPCTALIGLATLGATLGGGRPAPRLGAVLPVAFFIGMIPYYYIGRPNDSPQQFVVGLALFGLQAIITAVSLLVVRSCGWRLVSGDGVLAEKPLLPDDLGSGNAMALRESCSRPN